MGFWSNAPLTQADIKGLPGVYGEGSRAYANGGALRDCPYKTDDWQQQTWVMGFVEAATDPRYQEFRSTKPSWL